ncbi:MAG: flagellar motor switch protein FliN [Candidatus Acidiferrales bacterium]
MSTNPLPNMSVADQDFARIWAESTTQVLEELAGAPFTLTPHSPAPQDESPAETTWARFKVSGQLNGELAFQIARPDAVRLTQLLMSEPQNASVAFDEGRVDALSEILRQFAGVASTACKSKFGGEVQFGLEANAAPEWQPVAHLPWIFAAPRVVPLQWTLAISPELHAALTAPLPDAAIGNSGAQMQHAQSDAEAADAAPPANLDLLLDVELEASLRFGQREMLLRDILELHPGSVIELDRSVQEPAELIVSGRVIAHGEVVIVDGNYGLRITDIAQANQRLQSLET